MRPKSLADEQAALVLDPIRDLVRRADASSWNDANDQDNWREARAISSQLGIELTQSG